MRGENWPETAERSCLKVFRTTILIWLVMTMIACGGGSTAGVTETPVTKNAIVGVSPADGAEQVAANSTISASFDRDVGPKLLNAKNFKVSGPNGTISGDVSYDSATRTSTFTPYASLQPQTTYTVTLTRSYSWSFTTGNDALPRLRGVMVSPPMLTEEALRILGKEWGANLVRWQLNWGTWNDPNYDATDMKKYDDWLERELTRLDGMLPACRENGLKVVIDLHTTPGGRNEKLESLLFTDKRYQDKFLEVWEKIARRYNGNDVVWGYDLANEPDDRKLSDGLMNWQQLATRAAQTVRAIDLSHAIIFEPIPAAPEGLRNQAPLPVSGVVYSIHMYRPMEFTHQGVFKDTPVGVSYPGMVKDVMWDKEQLRQALQPVIDFQQKYGAHIYVGEFSAIRWAPGDSAYNYLKDVMDIFEEYAWDWSYHAFREWQGWDVELSEDMNDLKPTELPGKRQMLLRSWFEKNVKM